MIRLHCCLLLLSPVFAQIDDELLKTVLRPKEEFEPSTNYDVSLNCHCVPYFQCDEHGRISTSGSVSALVIEPKLKDQVYNVKVCPVPEDGSVLLCCTLPEGYTAPPGHGSVVETTTTDALPTRVTNITEPSAGKAVCGRVLLDKRISDGEDTQFGEFPWMAMVLESRDGSINLFNCGASLIHPQVVLTAAHCVHNKKANLLMVRAGDHITNKIDATDEPLPHQDRHINEIRVMDKFNSDNFFNDVALLILDDPFLRANNVGTVCLPEAASTPANADERRYCVATGWGRRASAANGDSDFQTRLKKVTLEMIPDSSCEEKLRDTRLGNYFKLDKSFTCAKGDGKRDTCQGDGGGPLVCPAADGSFVQTGITAWGIGCGGEVPGVYADVAYARHWIDEQMQQLGFKVNGNFVRSLSDAIIPKNL